jgi:4-hydroxybenzoate polyprenyltransferase
MKRTWQQESKLHPPAAAAIGIDLASSVMASLRVATLSKCVHPISTLSLPLCVDLVGTVVRTDPAQECLLLLVRRNALYLLLAVIWLMKGRAELNAQVAARIRVNPASLPYNDALLDWLRSERYKGRRIWLCSNCDDRVSQAIAGHLGIFDQVVAANAAARMQAAPIPWHEFATPRGTVRAALRAMRPHQWAKNVLLFIPLLAAHRANDAAMLGKTLLGFAAFCLCASAVYLCNDMLDIEADRQHTRKSKRPFAAGDLPLSAGFALVLALTLGTVFIAAFLPAAFQEVIAFYFALTLGYSLGLKKLVMIDTLTLAVLYTVRVIAGAAAVELPLSFWLLLFCAFAFLSLAFVKRYAELDAVHRRQGHEAVGRGYNVSDLPMVEGLGIAAGYMSVLVLALYINSPAISSLYRHPQLIWPLCGLMLYWISRVWMKAHRGRMHDDPVIFAMRDRVSLAVGLLAAAVVYAAT